MCVLGVRVQQYFERNPKVNWDQLMIEWQKASKASSKGRLLWKSMAFPRSKYLQMMDVSMMKKAGGHLRPLKTGFMGKSEWARSARAATSKDCIHWPTKDQKQGSPNMTKASDQQPTAFCGWHHRWKYVHQWSSTSHLREISYASYITCVCKYTYITHTHIYIYNIEHFG